MAQVTLAYLCRIKPDCPYYGNPVSALSSALRKIFSNFRKHFAVLKRYKSESRRKGGCHDRRAIYRVSDRTVEILLYDMRKCQ